ncbi:hypothetical protein [Streptomyces sp. A012304]|uniref:hypothetical protein n=1 Tax=Streptomyces sp. A012304 TaxID=375446 RepID=UPI0022310547|nr:hypothetical protein [Streptomyces sp. A012304]GKQ35280.1 hypothetical protein ALMP_18250 [Streptomyces sp. A012304]
MVAGPSPIEEFLGAATTARCGTSGGVPAAAPPKAARLARSHVEDFERAVREAI